MRIVESQSLDVYRNLAIEEYLMERVVDRGPVLFLWRSDCAVVMGKNQNPWQECHLGLMRAEEVPLARRISGGGTVYHDAGNLNYCVMVDRAVYREQQAFEMVVHALAPFGIRAQRTGVSNLSLDGKKFSGNAFCFRKGRALHHGTLLLNTDLQRLGRYLGSELAGIETHAIASVPADVLNLGLDVGDVSRALEEEFTEKYGSDDALQRMGVEAFDPAVLEDMYVRQRSAAWQLSATPRFSVDYKGCRLDVVKGRVVNAEGAGAERYLNQDFSELYFG